MKHYNALLGENCPLVSVCISAYNSAEYIEETLDSLFNQDYPTLEIIVVNDGSTDQTGLILSKINKPNFRFSNQGNRGASAARNAAFNISSGAYIKFMDSDDLINTECISKQVLRLNGKANCVTSSQWGRFYGNDIKTLKVEPERVWRDMAAADWVVESLIDCGRNMMQCGMFLIPRKTIEKVGLWNEQLSLIDDFEYLIRVILGSSEVLFCDNALLLYRSGVSNNLSGQKSRKHLESAFTSVSLGTANILRSRNDKISRLACANVYQEWAFGFYPDHYDLYQKCVEKIRELGGSRIKIGGSILQQLLVGLLGWKRTKRYKKKLIGRY